MPAEKDVTRTETTDMVKQVCLRVEGLVVHAMVRMADRFLAPRSRRRGLSPYVLLVVEAAEGGADRATALMVARRLLSHPTAAGGTPTLRRLQRAARQPQRIRTSDG
jgi:hypothetical protein